jgi:hypothetical protein
MAGNRSEAYRSQLPANFARQCGLTPFSIEALAYSFMVAIGMRSEAGPAGRTGAQNGSTPMALD